MAVEVHEEELEERVRWTVSPCEDSEDATTLLELKSRLNPKRARDAMDTPESGKKKGRPMDPISIDSTIKIDLSGDHSDEEVTYLHSQQTTAAAASELKRSEADGSNCWSCGLFDQDPKAQILCNGFEDFRGRLISCQGSYHPTCLPPHERPQSSADELEWKCG